jgi:hypothetical protein
MDIGMKMARFPDGRRGSDEGGCNGLQRIGSLCVVEVRKKARRAIVLFILHRPLTDFTM